MLGAAALTGLTLSILACDIASTAVGGDTILGDFYDLFEKDISDDELRKLEAAYEAERKKASKEIGRASCRERV